MLSFLQSFVFVLAFLQSAMGFVTPRSLGLSRSNTACAAGVADMVQETINSADVVIFSKSACPFCKKTKALFDELDVKYSALEIDQEDNGPEIQDALKDLTGQRTVPNVFIKGKHLGGNDDTQKANKDGSLLKMLE